MKDLKECQNVMDILNFLEYALNKVQNLHINGMLTQGMCISIEKIIRESAATKIMTYED